MEQERIFDRRMDYLRITISGTPDEVVTERGRYEEFCARFTTIVHGTSNGKPYKTYPWKSPNVHTWVSIFETWGKAADALAATLPAHKWRHVSRFDWREEVPNPPLSLRELEDRAHKYCQGALRITRDTSRLRSRRNGRDGGGELLGIGSHASDTRITLYKRGTAEYACEAQLSGKQLKALIEQAFYEHSQEPYPSMYDLMSKLGNRKLQELVQLRLSLPFDVLTGKEAMDNQHEIESLLDLPLERLKEEVWNVCEQVSKEQAILWVYEFYKENDEAQQVNALRLFPLPADEYSAP